MRESKSFLRRVVAFLFAGNRERNVQPLKKRKLTLETLESREMLSVNVYDNSLFDNQYYNDQEYTS